MSDGLIGKSPKRVGGLDRVTGAQRFVADIHLDDALQVKLLHLDCAHARIRSIDTRAASQVEGVRCILTAADLPQPVPRFGPAYQDRPVLADGEVKYYGEPVAAVAAETLDAAETAAELVQVDYEELPGIYTIEEALDSKAPLVQDPSLRSKSRFAQSNILDEWRFGWGGVDQAQADCIVENRYTFPMVTHFAIETHAFIAAPDKDGVVIWSSIQHPYILQRVLAEVLNLPEAKVRVLAPDPGGGFGGKGYPKYEPLLAFLALRIKRPVRLVLTLEETFQAVRRAACQVHARSGFNPDGTIVFQDIEADFLVGAYADIAARVVSKASYVACGPYRVPHARIVSRGLLSHTVPSTAFRGFGIPQMSWAIESQLDQAARRLGLDSVEIRRRNLAEKGEAIIPGDTPADGNWHQALAEAADAIGWGKPLGKHRGRGIALGLKNSASVAVSFALVRMHPDGSVTVMSGTSDMGQGARTILSQIAAETLGLPLERVRVVMGDTSVIPFDASTSASRSTVFMGNAVLRACEDIRAQLRRMTSETYRVPESEVQVRDGQIRFPGCSLSYAEFMPQYFGSILGEVVSIGYSRGKYIPDHPLGGKVAFWEFVCQAVEVEVDEETGKVQIVDLVIVSDVGKALNPRHVEMQDVGAAVMGLGHTLMEHLVLDGSGRVMNLGALDYRIPTTKDMPDKIQSLFLENEDGPGPFGAKGTGESGILAIAPAVASAVTQATGVVIRDLPLTPESVWRAIVEQKSAKSEPNSEDAKTRASEREQPIS